MERGPFLGCKISFSCVTLAMKLLNLIQKCHDKESAVRFLQDVSILPASLKCSRGHEMTLTLSDRQDRWRCCIRECREEKPLRKGTWLQDSRLPYYKVVLFIYFWSKNIATIKFCEEELDMNHNTAVDWSNYVREVCAWRLLKSSTPIGGPGNTVEIDESCFSRRKNHMGRQLPTQWVFGGICRETKDCFMYCVPDRTSGTLLDTIRSCVLPGTTLISDCWKGYTALRDDPNYIHLTVNHRMNFVDPDTAAHTQTIESTWRNAKMKNKSMFGTHRTMIESYLCEFLYRCKVKNGNGCLFDRILKDIAEFWCEY